MDDEKLEDAEEILGEFEYLRYLPDDQLMEHLNNTLPCFGEMEHKDDFVFLKLPPIWEQVGDLLVRLAENKYQYDSKVKTSVHKFIKLSKEKEKKGGGGKKKGGKKEEGGRGGGWGGVTPEEARVMRCPGGEGVGFHISIGKAAKNRVHFKISRWMHYTNQALPSPSRFDTAVYPCEFICLRVEWAEGEEVEQVSSPHITIAVLAFVKK